MRKSLYKLNIFVTIVDDFLVDKRPRLGWESMLCAQILDVAVNVLQVLWPHVFGGVHSGVNDRKNEQLIAWT
jgi:hypothetical protein